MAIRCFAPTFGSPVNAGDLGQAWSTPGNANADDGSLATSTVDADVLLADSRTDYLVLPVVVASAPRDTRSEPFGVVVRAFKAGKGAARLSDVRFVADDYTSGNLSSGETLTDAEQSFAYTLADAPNRPAGGVLRTGGRQLIRAEAISGYSAVAIDAIIGDAEVCFRIEPGMFDRGRNYRYARLRGTWRGL